MRIAFNFTDKRCAENVKFNAIARKHRKTNVFIDFSAFPCYFM